MRLGIVLTDRFRFIWAAPRGMRALLPVSKVPTKENMSDDPSREKYNLLEKLGAIHVRPRLSQLFRQAQTWSALSILDRRPSSSP